MASVQVMATMAVLAAGPATVPELPLAEALAELERQNLTLAQARGRADEAAALADQARAPLLPGVALQGSWVRNSDEFRMGPLGLPGGVVIDRLVQPLEALSVTGSLRVPLVVPTAWYDAAAARSGARAAEASAEALRVQLRAGFTQAAWAAAAAEEVEAASERAVGNAAELARSAERRQRAGTAPQLDVLKARTEEVRRESDLARARAEAERARLALGVLLGREGPVRVSLPASSGDLLPLTPALSPSGGEGEKPGGPLASSRAEGEQRGGPLASSRAEGERRDGSLSASPLPGLAPGAREGDAPGADPGALVGEALAHRPELAAQRARVEAADAALRASRARYAPQLSASASAFAQDVPYPTGERQGWRASLDLTWPLFDGGLREARIRQAAAQRATAGAAAEAQRLQVVQEVSDGRRDVAVARERLRLAESQRRLADDAAASARRGFEAGIASSLDVIDANDRLYLADVGLADARARLAQAQAALARALGR